jgi:hypothetical protein
MKTYTKLEQELHETQKQMLAMRQPGVKTQAESKLNHRRMELECQMLQIRRDNTGIDTSDNQTQQKG